MARTGAAVCDRERASRRPSNSAGPQADRPVVAELHTRHAGRAQSPRRVELGNNSPTPAGLTPTPPGSAPRRRAQHTPGGGHNSLLWTRRLDGITTSTTTGSCWTRSVACPDGPRGRLRRGDAGPPAARAGARVTAIDLDAPSIELARRQDPRGEIDYLRDDFLTHDFARSRSTWSPRSPRCTTCPRRRRWLGWAALLRPGGRLAVVGLARARLAGRLTPRALRHGRAPVPPGYQGVTGSTRRRRSGRRRKPIAACGGSRRGRCPARASAGHLLWRVLAGVDQAAACLRWLLGVCRRHSEHLGVLPVELVPAVVAPPSRRPPGRTARRPAARRTRPDRCANRRPTRRDRVPSANVCRSIRRGALGDRRQLPAQQGRPRRRARATGAGRSPAPFPGIDSTTAPSASSMPTVAGPSLVRSRSGM